MWYLAISILAIISLIFGITGILKTKPESPSTGQTLRVDHRLQTMAPRDSINGKSSREEIEKKLTKLAKSPAPTSLKPGAMCYDMAGPPERVEYVCPICGEKTLYTDDKTYFIFYDLQTCRTAITSIEGLDIRLDEKQFCKKCSPDVTKPELCLNIYYKGEEAPQHSCNISAEDVDLLYEFMSGKNKHTSFNDHEYPLKDYTPRLKELLGIK